MLNALKMIYEATSTRRQLGQVVRVLDLQPRGLDHACKQPIFSLLFSVKRTCIKVGVNMNLSEVLRGLKKR